MDMSGVAAGCWLAAVAAFPVVRYFVLRRVHFMHTLCSEIAIQIGALCQMPLEWVLLVP